MKKELPSSLVQLMVQVEYGRQFKDALKRYRGNQQAEAAHGKRTSMSGIDGSISSQKLTTVFSDAEAALSKSRIKSIDTEYKSMFHEIMKIGDVVPESVACRSNKEDLNCAAQRFSWAAQFIRAGALVRKLPQRACDFGFPRRCTDTFRRATLRCAG